MTGGFVCSWSPPTLPGVRAAASPWPAVCVLRAMRAVVTGGASRSSLPRTAMQCIHGSFSLCVVSYQHALQPDQRPATPSLPRCSTPGQCHSLLLATGRHRPRAGLARGSRSPVGCGQRAHLGSVGAWPMANLPARSLGAGPNRYPPPGVTGDGFPPPEGCMQQPAAASRPTQRCGGPPFGKLSGGNWMASGGRASLACSAPRAGSLRASPSL